MPEQQARLAGQTAGASGSGAQAGDRLVRSDTPGMLILHS